MDNLLTILYVKNQTISTTFYQHVLQISPSLNVPGMTEFTLFKDCKLGIMPENSIAKIISPPALHPNLGTQIPRCEIYIRVNKPQQYIKRAITKKGKMVSTFKQRDWGDKVGYISDLDGHIIAFAEKQ